MSVSTGQVEQPAVPSPPNLAVTSVTLSPAAYASLPSTSSDSKTFGHFKSPHRYRNVSLFTKFYWINSM